MTVLGRSNDHRGALVTALAASLVGMVASLTLATSDWRRDRRTRPPHRKCPEEVANTPVHSRQH